MSNNIADKEYQKLSIQVSLNGLSFFSQDTIHNISSPIEKIKFSTNPLDPFKEQLEYVFSKHEIFTKKYDTITVVHENNIFSPVPTALYDKGNLSEYLSFSTKTLPFDQYYVDIIENHNINNVYVPNPDIIDLCNQFFGSYSSIHATSILTKNLLDISKNSYETQFFVHVKQKHFEITVINRGKLLLINSFQYTSKEDFLYYTLFVAEQLKLNPETFQLFFLGDIKPHDELYAIAYKYVRHVYLLDEHSCNPKSLDLKYSDCLKHFILINA